MSSGPCPLRAATDSAISRPLPTARPRGWSMAEMSPTVGRPVFSPMATMVRHRSRESRFVRHEGAAAGLDVEDDAVGPQGQLLAHDRGGDERDAADRGRGVAKRVELPVGRHDLVRLAADGHAGLGQHPPELRGRQEDVHPRDGLELVEGAAGVAQAPAGEHGHTDAAGGDERSDDEADLVADASGAVLVDLRPGQAVQGDAAAGGEHGLGEVGRLPRVQAADVHGHQPGRDLLVGDPAAGASGDDERDLLPRELAAVALPGDDLVHAAGHGILPALRISRRRARTCSATSLRRPPRWRSDPGARPRPGSSARRLRTSGSRPRP